MILIGVQGPPADVPSDPRGLELQLEYLKETYGSLPVYVQENGKQNSQPEAKPLLKNKLRCIVTHVVMWLVSGMGSADDSLDDTDRVGFLGSYVESTLNAMRKGADVRGYFAWAFVDLFELLAGYQSRYGLYRVDFADEGRPRQARLSARWYSSFLKRATEPLRSFLGRRGSRS
uniref:Uncharacterized protein n=1 Tax=Aegilops tauschii subsp. strangulata TaxID=200361 RepID=A0A453LUZ0_AEGTS